MGILGKGAEVTLLEVRADRPVRILEIADARARAQCIRFGIGEGTVVAAERMRLGPVLVRHANCELALGREIAGKILVEEAPEEPLPEGGDRCEADLEFEAGGGNRRRGLMRGLSGRTIARGRRRGTR